MTSVDDDEEIFDILDKGWEGQEWDDELYKTMNHSEGEEDDPDKSSKKAQEQRYKEDTGHRHILVVWVMWLMSIWLVAVFILFLVAGDNNLLTYSDSVLITLLATTTTTVIGLPLVVLQGLFNVKNK